MGSKNQRPELWNLFNGKKKFGEHFRVFPISNWTEMDIWEYIKKEKIALPSLYFSHEREVIRRGDTILAHSPFITLKPKEKVTKEIVRFRTIGDLTITGELTESEASTLDHIIAEVAAAHETERGNRADDQRSEAAMEERKKEGYF